MNLDAYFERIGFTDGGSGEERLRRVHLAHITHIPFENLDVYNGKPFPCSRRTWSASWLRTGGAATALK